MRPAELRALLGQVRRGRLTAAAAAKRIAAAPVERLGFATLDHQRALRTGFPEVIFGQGKTPAQIVAIAQRLFARHGLVLATRVDEPGRAALAAGFPGAEVHERARCVVLRRRASRRAGLGRVLVVCAGTADLPVADECAATLAAMGLAPRRIADVGVAGLHRLLPEIGRASCRERVSSVV